MFAEWLACKLCLNGMPVPLLRNGYSILGLFFTVIEANDIFYKGIENRQIASFSLYFYKRHY